MTMHDLTVIGAGPAGLSAAKEARLLGLSFIVLERGVAADTVYRYPLGTILFSTSNEVELEPGSLPSDRKPTREEVLAHYNQVAFKKSPDVRCGQQVVDIAGTKRGMEVRTRNACYLSRAVLAAIGGFGKERRLNIPGESPERVSYRFSDPAPFKKKMVMIIGGGNSAAEAAVSFCRAGANVTLSTRAENLYSAPSPESGAAAIKPWVREPLDRAAAEGLIRIYTGCEVAEIGPDSALIKTSEGASERIECDHIFALIGADPDTSLLESAGARIAGDGRPVYNPLTNETTLSGLFVAGHLTREKHIKSAIESARKTVRAIAGGLREGGFSYGRAQG